MVIWHGGDFRIPNLQEFIDRRDGFLFIMQTSVFKKTTLSRVYWRWKSSGLRKKNSLQSIWWWSGGEFEASKKKFFAECTMVEWWRARSLEIVIDGIYGRWKNSSSLNKWDWDSSLLYFSKALSYELMGRSSECQKMFGWLLWGESNTYFYQTNGSRSSFLSISQKASPQNVWGRAGSFKRYTQSYDGSKNSPFAEWMGPGIPPFFIHIRTPLESWGRSWEFQILYGKLWWGDGKSLLRWTNGAGSFKMYS